jgi:hypothetical protein
LIVKWMSRACGVRRERRLSVEMDDLGWQCRSCGKRLGAFARGLQAEERKDD